MRLVFMGTPVFVLPVLDALLAATEVQIAGVYTPPDRPRGRGRSAEMAPVKSHALERGLAVYQPASLRRPSVQEELASLRPDVIVVAAYGRFLPPPVLETPPHGCLNLHPSLLPEYRGPSPVVTTLLDGRAGTGVSLMRLDPGMDTGPIIAQREHPISPEDTAETLTAALFRLGADLLVDRLDPWVAGELSAQTQDESRATVTRKLERTDGQADWMLPAEELERRRRAYTPWPGLFTHWQDQVLKLLDVTALPKTAGGEYQPGRVVPLEPGPAPVGVMTPDGVLGLKRLQLEGRRPTTAGEFLRGYPQFLGAQL